MRVVSVEERPFGSEVVPGGYPRVVNYITNPRFETNTTGWAAGGAGVTIARDTVVFDTGVASLRIDTPNPGTSSDRGEFAITLVDGEQYLVRARGRGVSGFTQRLWVADSTGASLGNHNITADGTFKSHEFTFTANANNTHKIRFGKSASGHGGAYYLDTVQVIRVSDGITIASYVDGSMSGYGWSGTADASTSVETGYLEVVDSTDFEEEGGRLTIGAETVAYTVAQEDGRITLAAPLAGSYAEEELVHVAPYSVERVAHLTSGDKTLDDEDTMEARVPHALYDKLPVGLRDVAADEGEAVAADYDGDEFIVTDLLGQEPATDGSFIVPNTVPPAAITDGLTPTSSPTPTVVGGIRSLFVLWTPIVNHDPVTHEVHVSTSSGFTPSGATYVGEVKGSSFQIRTLPGTTDAPAYGTTYYVKLVAFDEDGAAPTSAEASGTPAGVDGALGDIVVNGVIADNIVANDALFAKLQALLIIANTLKTADSGQRVEIDTNGIRLVSSLERVLVDLPTDPAAQPTFQGNVITGGLVVTGNALFQGTDNVLDQGAAITMLAAVANPSTVPTLTHDWESFSLPGHNSASGNMPIQGLHYDPSGSGAQPTFITLAPQVADQYALVESKASDGTLVRSTIGALVGAGVTRVGSFIWVLAYNALGSKVYLVKHNQSDLSVAATIEITADMPVNLHSRSFNATIGTDDTDILLLGLEDITGGSRLEVRKFNATTGAFISANNTDLTAGNYGIQPKGICAQGGALWVYYDSSSGPVINSISASTYLLVANTTAKTHATAGWGLDHDGTRFWTARFSDSLTKHTNWTWTTQSPKYWVGYTWRDSAAAKESLVSPLASIDMTDYRFSRVKVTRPSFPGGGVDSARLYVLRNATSPATTALLRQDTTFITSETTNPFYMFNYDTAGAAPPVASSFGGTASGIKNTAGQVLVGSNWERYILLAAPFTKGVSSTAERTLVESANNLPNLVAPQSADEVGAVYEFELAGLYDHTTAGNLTIRVKIGTVTLESRVIAAPGSNQAGQGWYIRGHLVVKTTGATGTVNGAWLAQFSGATTPTVARGFNATDQVIDLTTTQRVDLTAQYGASAAANVITVTSCKIQRVA